MFSSRLVCIYSNVAGNIALDYYVYFLKIFFFNSLNALVLSNIASFIARLKACANQALRAFAFAFGSLPTDYKT
jgi:hypothetical protein